MKHHHNDRFYHCRCIEECIGDQDMYVHDENRFYHCDCLELDDKHSDCTECKEQDED